MNGSSAQFLHIPILSVNASSSPVGDGDSRIGVSSKGAKLVALDLAYCLQYNFRCSVRHSHSYLRVIQLGRRVHQTRFNLALVNSIFDSVVETRLGALIRLQIPF